MAAVVIGQAALEFFLLNRLIPAESLFGRDIAHIARFFLLTPFFLAVHRYIILGEVTRRYAIEPQSERFQMFFGWTVVVFVAACLVEGVVRIFGPRNPANYVIVPVAGIAICAIATRMTILFPAIAVDAPGATWRHAVRATRGHGWYIFFLLPFACLPTVIAIAATTALAVRVFGRTAGVLLGLLLLSAGVVVLLAITVAIASRLYQALRDRMNETTGAGK